MGEASPINVRDATAVYYVGLGKVGGLIISRFAERNMRYLRLEPREAIKDFTNYVPSRPQAAKVQIIDMVLEEEVRNAVYKSHALDMGDDVKILSEETDKKAYSFENIMMFASRYLPQLLKYFPIIREQVRLIAGGGVHRYRPLSRYFIYHTHPGKGTHPFIQALKDVFQNDIGSFSTLANLRRIDVVVTCSLGGGFGSGSFLDVLGILSAMLAIRLGNTVSRMNFFLNLILPAGFSVEPSGEDLVMGDDRNSKASAAAALLEYLYIKHIHRIRGTGFRDALSPIMDSSLRLGDPSNKYRLTLVDESRRGTYLILSAYSTISTTDIKNLYEEFDKEHEAFLTALNYAILPDLGDNTQYLFPTVTSIEIPPLKEGDTKVIDAIQKVGPDLLEPVMTFTANMISLEISKDMLGGIQDLLKKRDDISNKHASLESKLRYKESLKNALEEARARLSEALEILGKSGEGQEVPHHLQEMLMISEKLHERIEAGKNLISSIVNYVSTGKYGKANEELKKARNFFASLPGIGSLRERADSISVNITGKKLSGLTQEVINRLTSITRTNTGSPQEAEKILKMLSKPEYRELIMLSQILSDISDSLLESISKLSELSDKVENVVRRAKEKCRFFLQKVFKDPSCRVCKNAEQLYEDMNNKADELRIIKDQVAEAQRKVSGQLHRIKDSINDKINELELAIEELSKEIEELRTELADIDKQMDRIKEEIGKSIKIVEKAILSKHTYLPDEAIQYITELIREGHISKALNLTLDQLYSELLRSHKNGREVAAKFLVALWDTMKTYIQRSPLISIDQSACQLIESMFKESRYVGGMGGYLIRNYIIVSKEYKRLLDEMKNHIPDFRNFLESGENKVVVTEGMSKPSIIIASVTFGVPLIAISEVRELLREYMSKVRRAVLEVKKQKSWSGKTRYVPGKQIIIEEPRGYMFHGLILDDDFREFIDNVAMVLEAFEQDLYTLSI